MASIDQEGTELLFSELAASWQRVQLHRPTTVAQVDAHLRNHILPEFRERPIAEILPSDVQAWVRDRSEMLAPATVEVVFRIFSAILKQAVTDRLLERNPATGVRLPRKNRRPLTPPTAEQVASVREELPGRYQALVTFAAGMGLRQGECFGLTVDRVSFTRQSVEVDRQMVFTGSGSPQWGPPKTQASFRSVPLPRVVAAALTGHIEQYPAG